MSAAIINGKEEAARIRARLALHVQEFKLAAGRTPCLAVVLVGDDPASHVYVGAKRRAAQEMGLESKEVRLPAATIQETLGALIHELNQDDGVDGILVQLPLPRHLDAQAVIESIHPGKDVDGFHPLNVGKLGAGLRSLVPCTPLGSLALIKGQRGDLSGLHAVVVGRSNIVGKPMAQLLLAESCTVTIAHSRTRDLEAVVGEADVLVVAIGRPEAIPGAWIKPGAIVVDVGINQVGSGAQGRLLVGDVDYEGALPRAGAITPVPGGVGPMTIAMLMFNTLSAAFARKSMRLDAQIAGLS